VYPDRPGDGPDKAFDDDAGTGWRASGEEGWLEVDLGQPRTVDTALILEGSSYFGAEKFELLCEVGGRWKTLAEGTKLGQPAVLRFEPATAQKFRLVASRADRQLIVREFQLYGPQSY
jgi:alpha-L-fucosidase